MNFTNNFTNNNTRYRGNQNLSMLKYVVIFLIISTGKSYAQDRTLAGLEYFNYPKSDIKENVENQQALKQGFTAFANIPVKFKNNKTVLNNGFSYALVENSSYNSPLFESTEKKIKLHKISYSLSLIQKLNKNWTLMARIIPTVASDFEEKLSMDDFNLPRYVLVSRKIGDKWVLGGGLIYTTMLGEPRRLPSVLVKYAYKRHLVSAFLPLKLEYSCQIDNKKLMRIGLRAAMNGSISNITAQDFSNNIPSQIDKVKFRKADIGMFLNYRLKIIKLEASGGISVNREEQYIDINEKEHKFDISNGPFFKIGLAIVPPRKNKNPQ